MMTKKVSTNEYYAQDYPNEISVSKHYAQDMSLSEIHVNLKGSEDRIVIILPQGSCNVRTGFQRGIATRRTSFPSWQGKGGSLIKETICFPKGPSAEPGQSKVSTIGYMYDNAYAPAWDDDWYEPS